MSNHTATPVSLGISREAFDLARNSDIFDLHIDTFIPPRLWGYDPLKAHGKGLFRGRFFGHLDLPRMQEGGLSGAMWSITTNPFRSPESRWLAFLRNLAALRALCERSEGKIVIATNYREYKDARATGAHVCLPAIQGGNALEAAPNGVSSVPDNLITRITLVHLTNSCYGVTSSPLARKRQEEGLTQSGREFVEQLNEAHVFVDLAHINPLGFWDAHDVHDRSQPLIATHTGVAGVKPHWRNLDDKQIKAIADTGGTVGVIFAAQFLSRPKGPDDAEMVIEHLSHIIDVAGDDFASIGSDYDGAITPPRGLRDGRGYPRLVQKMLDRNWSEKRIRKLLGGNALRALRLLRP